MSGRLAAIRRASVHLGARLGSKPGRLCRPVATNPAVSAHLRVATRGLYVLRQCGLGIPNLPAAKAENLASGTASSATQCRSNPVFGRRLQKTGIFQIFGGDYRLILRESAQIRCPETDGGFVKARHWQAFPALLGQNLQASECLAGARRIRTFARWSHRANPQGAGVKTREHEQLSCSELTGFRALTERCWGDLGRLRPASGSGPAGCLPGRG